MMDDLWSTFKSQQTQRTSLMLVHPRFPQKAVCEIDAAIRYVLFFPLLLTFKAQLLVLLVHIDSSGLKSSTITSFLLLYNKV